ncbi:hypothetical protein JQN58_12270 [Aneurinibacillus sp. BA2021]|nr:hypothetical protein [Aneurinibacillus sp. BA2021]
MGGIKENGINFLDENITSFHKPSYRIKKGAVQKVGIIDCTGSPFLLKNKKNRLFLQNESYHTITSERTIFKENDTTQRSLPLEIKEEKGAARKACPPPFQPYNNKQSQVIFDIQELIPDHHVARVVDEMMESIPRWR